MSLVEFIGLWNEVFVMSSHPTRERGKLVWFHKCNCRSWSLVNIFVHILNENVWLTVLLFSGMKYLWWGHILRERGKVVLSHKCNYTSGILVNIFVHSLNEKVWLTVFIILWNKVFVMSSHSEREASSHHSGSYCWRKGWLFDARTSSVACSGDWIEAWSYGCTVQQLPDDCSIKHISPRLFCGLLFPRTHNA